MDYPLHESKVFTATTAQVGAVIEKAVKGLEGKVIRRSPETAQWTAFFNKTIHGNTLSDRTHFETYCSSSTHRPLQAQLSQLFGGRVTAGAVPTGGGVVFGEQQLHIGDVTSLPAVRKRLEQ